MFITFKDVWMAHERSLDIRQDAAMHRLGKDAGAPGRSATMVDRITGIMTGLKTWSAAHFATWRNRPQEGYPVT